MAVSSLKVCWSKLSARIRDYYVDVVDSYNRANAESENIPDGVLTRFARADTSGGDIRTPRGLILHGGHEILKSNHNKRLSNKHHDKQQRTILSAIGDGGCGGSSKSPAATGHHNNNNNHNHTTKDQQSNSGGHHKRHRYAAEHSHDSPSLFRTPEHSSARLSSHHHHHQNCQYTNVGSRLSQLGYTKRKTPQGQIYFVDANGRKDWHDPTVPKELLNANLDLDFLIGPLSANWEVRQTSSGRTYYTNHHKLTTQLTDPRLVSYKDRLMSHLRQINNNSHAYESIVSDDQLSRPPETITIPVTSSPNMTVPPPPSARSAVSNSRRHSNQSPVVVASSHRGALSNLRLSARVSDQISSSSTALACATTCQQQNSQNGLRLSKRGSTAALHGTNGPPSRRAAPPTLVATRQPIRDFHFTATSDRQNQDRDLLDSVCGGTLDTSRSRRNRRVAGALLLGSHQNLSHIPITTHEVMGNSNTLSGIPTSWFEQPREDFYCQQDNLDNNRRLSCNQETNLTVNSNLNSDLMNTTSSRLQDDVQTRAIASGGFDDTSASYLIHTSTDRNLSYNDDHMEQSTAASDPFKSQEWIEKERSDINGRRTRELTDKISLLRQELLKQQDLAHSCKISINRKRIFEESFRAVSQMSPRELKKRLLIKFRGEEGLDYGGVAREWFYLLSKEILNPAYGLFQYTSDDIYNLQINPDSGIVYREHLSYLNFCGRFIGMAVFHNHFIEGRFTLPFYKMLLNKPITLDDIENVDPELYRSLCWILENDITEVIDTTFLVQHNSYGQLQEYELKDNGRNISVTNENKWEYVSLYVNYRCRRGIEHQFAALQRGFHEIISPHLVENFDEHELELLIGGLSKINIEDWKLHTKLKNCNTETSLVIWFWDIVKLYDEDKRARLLQFVTGSPRVPIQGFKALQGNNSEPRLFTIHMIRNGNTDNLPKSHTCFNRIDLPPYETYDKLRDKLTQAIEETMGFAMQ